jgi:iron(III) transport system substrate-binding protein
MKQANFSRMGAIAVTLGLVCASSFSAAAGQTVTVYSSLDREFSGLTNAIIAEARRPRCDLFWNNEILNTLRLKEKGLLAPFHPRHADDIPETFKAKDGTWYGFAARARILIVNTKLVAETDRPKGIKDLLNPKWKGKIGIAKPLFGTTATHAACLFAAWGDDNAKEFFRDLKANGVQVLSGNKQVAQAAGSGQIAIGMTDTDDAMGEIDAGSPVAIVYPDREKGSVGTLFIPNTLVIMKGSRHQKAAEDLASHLLSPEIEAALARGPSAQIPLLKSTNVEARVETPKTVHAMEADFEAAAKIWDKVAAFLAAEFAG